MVFDLDGINFFQACLSFPGIPLIYEFDADLKPIRHYYLADDAKVKAATDKVVAQGKAAK